MENFSTTYIWVFFMMNKSIHWFFGAMVLVLCSCSEPTNPNPTSNSGINPKTTGSVQAIVDDLDSAYESHYLGCEAVLDSMVSGYIDFTAPPSVYGPKIKFVIDTKLGAYFGRSEPVLHDSAWLTDTVELMDHDTLTGVSVTGKDILHDVDSLIDLYDAGTINHAGIQSGLTTQRGRALNLSTYWEQKKVGSAVMFTKSSVDFWNNYADTFDTETGNMQQMQESDKRILKADRDGGIVGFFTGLLPGAYAGACYASIYEGLKIGFFGL